MMRPHGEIEYGDALTPIKNGTDHPRGEARPGYGSANAIERPLLEGLCEDLEGLSGQLSAVHEMLEAKEGRVFGENAKENLGQADRAAARPSLSQSGELQLATSRLRSQAQTLINLASRLTERL